MKKLETFSYLPPMTRAQITRQIEYILGQGWIPGIEYTDTIDPANSYWHWWKLPLFKAHTVDEVMAEIEACREAHPDCYIKVTAYDNRRRGQMQGFVVYRPQN